jgi:hypothetical protein
LKLIFTFEDIGESIRGEAALKAKGFFCSLDKTPRSLGVSCAYIIRVEAASIDEAAFALRQSGAIFIRAFLYENDRYEPINLKN